MDVLMANDLLLAWTVLWACVIAIFAGIVGLIRKAYLRRKRQKVQFKEFAQLKKEGRLRLADIVVHECKNKEIEVEVQFYVQEKFFSTAATIEALYNILQEDHYEYSNIESFLQHIARQIKTQGPRTKAIAEAIRNIKVRPHV